MCPRAGRKDGVWGGMSWRLLWEESGEFTVVPIGKVEWRVGECRGSVWAAPSDASILSVE